MKTYEADKGMSIHHAAEKACRLASEVRVNYALVFNWIEIIVSPYSEPDDIAMIYYLKSELRRLKDKYGEE